MTNIKLKNASGVSQTYENVGTIKVKDTSDNDVTFYQSLGQITTFESDTNTLYNIQSNQSGKATYPVADPIKSGYWFKGWSEVSHSYISANKVNLPKVYNTNKTLYGMWLEIPSGTASVTGLGNEAPSTVQFSVDSSFPTTFEEVTDINNNIFIKIPTMYRKILHTEDGQITSFAIATSKLDNDYQVYPCFLKEDGTTIMPYILIGKYMISSTSEATSKSGGSPFLPEYNSLATLRTLARAVGTGYQLFDWQMYILVRDLALTTKQGLSYSGDIFGIQNLNDWCGIDGIIFSSSTYIGYKPSTYIENATTETSGYYTLGYTIPPNSSGYVKKVGYDNSHPFANFPNDFTATSATYYKTQANMISAPSPVFSSEAYKFGRWTNNVVGGRLCYRPIAD